MKAEKSAWAQVIDGCALKDDHLLHALEQSDAMEDVGRAAVFLCLEHTLGLAPEDLDPEDDPWGWTDGLSDLFDERLAAIPYDDSGWFFRFMIRSSTDDEWGMDWFRIGDRGWITGVEWEHEISREIVLGTWAPFDDPDALLRAAERAYMWGWWRCSWLPHGSGGHYFRGNAALLLDCLSHLFAAEESDETGSGWLRRFCWPPPDVEEIPEGAWTYLEMEPATPRVWPHFVDKPPSNLDPGLARELVAMYLASHILPSELGRPKAATFQPMTRSGWRLVTEDCSGRALHLKAAVDAAIASRGECDVVDDWGVGLDAVLRCLAHTLVLPSAAVEEIRRQAEQSREHPASDTRPKYPGGDPRIPIGEKSAGEYHSTRDMEELVWSRSQEIWDASLNNILTLSSLVKDGATQWSRAIGCRISGGVGYLTTSPDDHGGRGEKVIDTWAPYHDDDAEALAISRHIDLWREPDSLAISYRLSGREPRLIASAVMYLCRDEREVIAWPLLRDFAVEHASKRPLLEDFVWAAHGCDPPEDPWWARPSAASADSLRGNDDFLRTLVVFYLVGKLMGRFGPDPAGTADPRGKGM